MKVVPLTQFLFFTLLLNLNCICQGEDYYIRLNQVGFLSDDLKTGVILSEKEIPRNKFLVVNNQNNDTVYSGSIESAQTYYGEYEWCYNFDFSGLSTYGIYSIKIGDQTFSSFEIGKNVYNHVIDSLMLFLKIQRCGPTNPFLHAKCHLSDATNIFSIKKGITVDVTGGWHDAGDYVKFFSTAALTTYMLLFSYEYDNEKFGFDNDKDDVPDILEEAKVGLDWLLRCNFSDTLFVIQVQDERDHIVGWRLPENDSLRYDRPAFIGMGKNLIGIFSAVMSLASRLWTEKFLDYNFAEKCINAAIQKYKIHKDVKDIEINHSKFYNDKSYSGKLSLGAIELFITTQDESYLSDAVTYADSANINYWWSWGDINVISHYKIARFIPRFSDYIKLNLDYFNNRKDNSLFNESTDYSWGTTTTLLGSALQVILFKSLNGSKQYDSLMILQRDYILGRNPWGISFVNGIGHTYSKHLHSQVAYFNGGRLPGAVTAGAAPYAILSDYKINRTDSSCSRFNTKDGEYYDDWNDYITNEATIFSNATALFVFGYFSDRKLPD